MSGKDTSAALTEQLKRLLNVYLGDETVEVFNGGTCCRLRGSVLQFDADAVIVDKDQHLLGIVRVFDSADYVSDYIMKLIHSVHHMQAFASTKGERPWGIHLFLVIPDATNIGKAFEKAWNYGSEQATIGVSVLEMPSDKAGASALSDTLEKYEMLLKTGKSESLAEITPLIQFLSPLLLYTRRHQKTAGSAIISEIGSELIGRIREQTQKRLPEHTRRYMGEDGLPEVGESFLSSISDIVAKQDYEQIRALHGIRVESFRAITNSEARFGKTTIIIGGNATGKTSLVEAIEYALCRALKRLSEESNSAVRRIALQNLSNQDNLPINGCLEVITRDSANAEETDKTLKIEFDDVPGVLDSEESPLGVTLSTVKPFILRQFQVREFVECKGGERGSETLSLIGLPTDKMKDSIQNALREYAPDLDSFVKLLKKQKMDVPSVISVKSSNVTKYINDFMISLIDPDGILKAIGTTCDCDDKVADAAGEIVRTRRDIAAYAREIFSYLRMHESAPEDVIVRINKAIQEHSEMLAKARVLTGQKHKFIEAYNKLQPLRQREPPDKKSLPSETNKLEQEFKVVQKKRAILDVIVQALDFKELIDSIEVVEQRIARVRGLLEDEEARDLLEKVLGESASLCMEQLFGVGRLLGELTSTIKGVDASASRQLEKEMARLKANEKEVSDKLKAASKPHERDLGSVLTELHGILEDAQSILKQEPIMKLYNIEPGKEKEVAEKAVSILKDTIERLEELDRLVNEIPDLMDCRGVILDIARGYEDNRPIGLLGKAVAFDVLRTQQDLFNTIADEIVGELVEQKFGVMLLELVSALSPSRWAQPVQDLKYDRKAQKPVIDLVITGSDKKTRIDAKYIINSAEASLLGLCWFMVGYLISGQRLSNVLVIDDPFMALDPAHQDFAARAVLRLLRAICDNPQVILVVPSQEAMNEFVKQIPPQRAEKKRRSTGDSANEPRLPFDGLSESLLPDVSVVTCSRISKGTCQFSSRATDELKYSMWDQYIIMEPSGASTHALEKVEGNLP